ncbi:MULTISPECIES: hypothetical protein [unclassified Saccharopolyspora]|nr:MULTISPECIES: hypothetical protein [unclassified Saccharopolyspora]
MRTRQEHIADVPDRPWRSVAEIGRFFAVYKAIEPGKCAEVRS